MSKHFFDYDDGDFAMSISDSMAMDSDGNLMMRLGNPSVQQLLLRIGIAFPINICVSRLPVSRTLLDVPAFPTTIFSLVNILASFGHRKTLLSLILADGYYDGFESRHRNEYTDSGASDLLLPK